MKNKKSRIIFIVLGLLLVFNILAWIAVFEFLGFGVTKVNFLSVGQGDAIFIETEQGHQILIDGGPDNSVLEKLGKEMPFWDRSLDVILLSHPEKDHITGLIEVLKKYKVDYVIWTGVKNETAEYEEWINLLEKSGANIITAQSGLKIKLGNEELDVLYPFENLNGELVDDVNDSSIIVKVVNNKISFLFTGDISADVEKIILQKGIDFDSDVLKIAHHGSKYSSSEDFIKSVSPLLSVIEVGKNNRYGHPSQDVLETLSKFGIKVLRTDLDGDVKLISDGTVLKQITN
jgi:competence protein ComEC